MVGEQRLMETWVIWNPVQRAPVPVKSAPYRYEEAQTTKQSRVIQMAKEDKERKGGTEGWEGRKGGKGRKKLSI